MSLVSGLRNTIALDFYYNTSSPTGDGSMVFWTDVVDDKIYAGTMISNCECQERPGQAENCLCLCIQSSTVRALYNAHYQPQVGVFLATDWKCCGEGVWAQRLCVAKQMSQWLRCCLFFSRHRYPLNCEHRLGDNGGSGCRLGRETHLLGREQPRPDRGECHALIIDEKYRKHVQTGKLSKNAH